MDTCHEHSRSWATLGGRWLIWRELNPQFIFAQLAGFMRCRAKTAQSVGANGKWRGCTWAFGRWRRTVGGRSVCVGSEIEPVLERVQISVIELRLQRRFATLNRVEKIRRGKKDVRLVGIMNMGVMVGHWGGCQLATAERRQ